MAAAVGNAAFARAVSGQRTQALQRQPAAATTGPAAGQDDEVARLADLVRAALVATLAGGGGQAEFVQALREGVEASFPASVVARVGPLAGVSARLGDRSLDHVSAADVLVRLAGLPPELGQAVSYGQDAYLRTVSRQVAHYLAQPLRPFPLYDYSVEDLSAQLEWVVEEWNTAEGILGLELEGTVDALVDARARYAEACGPDGDASARAAAGREVARLSRRALLVDDALRRLRSGDADDLREAPGPGPLEERLTAVAGEIDRIRGLEGSEQRTVTALGDRVELLAPAEIDVERRLGDELPGAVVLPEEALPETTDRASEQMLGELAARAERQAATVAQLREQVVPVQPRYSIDELAGVLVRWNAFMGPRGRDEDPFWRSTVALYDGLMEAFSHAGTEGGIGRALLMRVLEPAISRALPGAHADFSRDIGRLGPERVQPDPGGTASAPDVRYAERFRAAGAVEPSEEGEQRSRTRALGQQLVESPARFREAERRQREDGPARGGPVHFLRDEARRGWSYIVTTDQLGQETHEERSMPAEVAAYLLARTQHLRTLEQPHRPGIGELSVRSGGIEEARGTNAPERLHGDDDARNRTVDRDRARLAGVRREAGAAALPGPRPAQERVVSELLGDFTRYFDGYFAEHQQPEWRVTGVLYIAQVEYDVAGRFMAELTPAKLARALALAASIAAATAVLGRLGAAGRVAALALGRAMRHAGLTDPAAAIGILAWLDQAKDASTFHDARTKAFFARTIATDLGNLIQGAAAGSVVGGVRAVASGREPRTAMDLVLQIDPLLADPASREVFREEVVAGLEQRRAQAERDGVSDPEVVRLQAIVDALDGRSAAGRPSPDQVDLAGPAARTAQGTTRGGGRGGDGRGDAAPDPLRRAHEGWIAQMRDLAARPSGEPEGAPQRAGEELGPFASAAEAYGAYETQLRRPGGLEVGVFRHTETGEYVVKTGTANAVPQPRGDGPWEGVAHYHVNPGNVLTLRMPAPRDVQSAMRTTFRSRGPVTEFVEFPLPDGTRGRTMYRVDTDGRVTIELLREGGVRETRRYDTVEDYARAYDERTRYLDPDSPEYRWVLADLADYYSSRSRDWDDGGGERTSQGTEDPRTAAEAWLRGLRDRLVPEAQATMDDLRGDRPDPVEFRAWLEQRGDPERFLRGLAGRTPERAATRAAAAGERVAGLVRRLQGAGFFERPDVRDRVRSADHEWLRGAIAEAVGAGHARERYPADRGYEVLAGIHLVEDTGFTSLREWRAANPDRPEGEVYLSHGRVWVRRGELDVLVLRLREDGMREVVEMEEIKSGARDSPTGAREQVERAQGLMASVGPANPALRIHDRHRDITAGIDTTTAAGLDKAVTRGPVRGGDPSRHRGQASFDRSLGASTDELDGLVREIIAAGGSPPMPGAGPPEGAP